MIGSRRRDDILFNHRAAQIVRAVVQALPADIKTLSQPRRLNVRNTVEIQAADGKPSKIFIAGNPIGKALADRGVVRLQRPRNKRDESRVALLKLAQPLEM